MPTFDEFIASLPDANTPAKPTAPRPPALSSRYADFDAFIASLPDADSTDSALNRGGERVLGKLGTMAKALGAGIYSAAFDVLPKTLAETWRAGDVPLKDESWIDRLITEQNQDIASRALSPEEQKTDILGLTAGDVQAGAQNLGYSGASALGGMALGAGVAAPIPIPGARIIGGVIGAGTAGATVGYRATKDQFVQDIRDRALQQDPNITPEKWAEIKAAVEDDAQLCGFWEAAPEAVGNMLMAGIIKLPVGKVFSGIPVIKNGIARTLASAGVKVAGVLGEELPTETLTQYKKGEIEARQGLREKAPTLMEAFKEIAPQTGVTSLLTLGLGAGAQRAMGKRPAPSVVPPEATQPEVRGTESLAPVLPAAPVQTVVPPAEPVDQRQFTPESMGLTAPVLPEDRRYAGEPVDVGAMFQQVREERAREEAKQKERTPYDREAEQRIPRPVGEKGREGAQEAPGRAVQEERTGGAQVEAGRVLEAPEGEPQPEAEPGVIDQTALIFRSNGKPWANKGTATIAANRLTRRTGTPHEVVHAEDGWGVQVAPEQSIEPATPPEKPVSTPPRPEVSKVSEKPLAEEIARPAIGQTEQINGITRATMGEMLARGDDAVLEDISQGVEEHGLAQMQDAVRNQIQAEIAKAKVGKERNAVRANIAGLEPQINKILAGEKVEPETAKEPIVSEKVIPKKKPVLPAPEKAVGRAEAPVEAVKPKEGVKGKKKKHWSEDPNPTISKKETGPPRGTILSVGDVPTKTNSSYGNWAVETEIAVPSGNGRTKDVRFFFKKKEAEAFIKNQKIEISKLVSPSPSPQQDILSPPIAKSTTPQIPKGVNVKADGTPYSEKVINLRIANLNKKGIVADPVPLNDEKTQWGWREVVDKPLKVSKKAGAEIRTSLMAVPKTKGQHDYDAMRERADSLVEQGHKADDVYDVLSDLTEELGDGVLYSRTPKGPLAYSQLKQPGQKVEAQKVFKHITPILSSWRNAPATEVVQSEADLPQSIRDDVAKRAKKGITTGIKGVFHGGKVYLVADNISNTRDAERTLYHEALRHYGFRTFLGNLYDRTMLNAYSNEQVKVKIIEIADEYGLDIKERNERILAADEAIAAIADSGVKNSFVDRIVLKLQQWLRRVFPSEKTRPMSDREVRQLIANSSWAVREGKKGALAYTTKGTEFMPLGEDALYSRKGRLLADTPEFKKWFGDSKVVDEDGKPLVVYHGTTALKDFKAFDTKNHAMGTHFATMPDVADKIIKGSGSKARTLPVYLNIKNPLVLKDAADWHPPGVFNQLIEAGIATKKEYQAYLSSLGIKKWTLGEYFAHKEDAIRGLQKFILSKGYDGIKYKNEFEGGISYIAFSPEQIKSVYNRGTFDPNDERILYARKLKEAEQEATKERPAEPSAFEQDKDDWFGNKDWDVQKNSVEAGKLQEAIKAALGQKRFNKQCQDADAAIHKYLDLKRNPGHLDTFYADLAPEQKRIADLARTIEDNPGLRAVADHIAKQYDQIGKMALDEGVIFNTLDNYVNRIWKRKKGIPSDTFAKFKTSTRHAKHRVFETIFEGESKGFELQITGATNNLNVLKDEIARVVEDRRLLKKMLNTEFKDTGENCASFDPVEGYQKIEHPNFKWWRKVGTSRGPIKMAFIRVKAEDGSFKAVSQRRQDVRVQVTGWAVVKRGNQNASKVFDTKDAAEAFLAENPGYRMEERATVWEKQDIYAPEKIAKSLNKILSTSKLKGIPFVDVLTKYNALTKAWILQTSFFHHLAFTRSYLLGTRHKTMQEWRPLKAYKEGLKAINELNPEIELLVRNGLTLGRMQDWEESILQREQTIFGRILDKTAATKEIKDKINQFREWQAKFLFQNFGAGLKAQAALIEYRNALKEHPEMDTKERAKMVARLINDDFGGLHLQRLERDATVQHIYRLLMLAPDWCVDSKTRAMTKTGWKSYNELSDEDEIMAFNPGTQRLEWSKLKDKYVNENYDGDMIQIKNFNRSIMMTPEHTCYVRNFTTERFDIVKAKDLQTNSMIPRCADFDAPTEKTFNDYFVKLVGWLVTDGHIKKNKLKLADGTFKEYRYGRISQAKPHTVQLLKDMGLSYKNRGLSKSHDKFVSNYPCYRFKIPNDQFKKMEELGISESLNWEFLSKLTSEQRQILYDTMMLADGTGQNRFCGQEKPVFYMTMLQTMMGLPSTFYQQEKKCWRTRILTRGKEISCWGHHNNKIETRYKGTIWCPSVKTGFWLAEREGLIFITGNTESNVRTMVKAFHAGGKEETALYRKFWASVITKGLTATILVNMLLAAYDDEDFIERYHKAWKAGNFRWLGVDITPIYKLMGGKTTARKYFSLFGHFQDPMKFIVHPFRSAHHKGSVIYRTVYEAASGMDWKGQGFTSLSELMGVDDKGLYVTSRKGYYKKGEPKGGKMAGKLTDYRAKKGVIDIGRFPSYAMAQIRGYQPIQIQNLIAWRMGEIDWFDFITRSSGLHTSTSYPSEKNTLEDYVDQVLRAKREGESLAPLREKIRQLNNEQKALGEKGVVVPWVKVIKKANKQYQAERAAERR